MLVEAQPRLPFSSTESLLEHYAFHAYAKNHVGAPLRLVDLGSPSPWRQWLSRYEQRCADFLLGFVKHFRVVQWLMGASPETRVSCGALRAEDASICLDLVIQTLVLAETVNAYVVRAGCRGGVSPLLPEFSG